MGKFRQCEECGAALDHGEVCDCTAREPEENAQILELTQAPIIYENLSSVKQNMDGIRAHVYGLPLTEESLKEVKRLRAGIRQQFDELEDRRKAVKKAVMEPYDRAEATYKECISGPFSATDNFLKGWIDGYQDNIKVQCENRLREYFTELCQSFNLDFLKFEDCGVTVDMALARQKEPRKAMDAIYDFVNRVQSDVDAIMNMEFAAEIFAAYRQRLNLADAISFVDNQKNAAARMQEVIVSRQEYDREQKENRQAILAAAPEIAQQPQETTYSVAFLATGTLSALKRMKEFSLRLGISFENIDMEDTEK